MYIPEEILLIKNGELALKGLNRHTFEDALIRNLRFRLKDAGHFMIRKAQSTITIEPQDEHADLDLACERVSKVFGIAAFSRAHRVDKTMDAILDGAVRYMKEPLSAAATFKVEAKRSDKSFPLRSPEICAETGARLLEAYPHLRVDVHAPDVLVMVEVRDYGAYIHTVQIPGAGGMPVGTGGQAAVLISGGIDSPVAAYMMAKRGIRLTAVHFASPPYTSERAEQKVKDLLARVAQYAGRMSLCIVPFTHIQEEIREHCPEELFTVIMRRFMMRIASLVAQRESCGALITGESVGQVASQTIPAIACTDAAASLPVFRPLIGMDKEEIVTISRRIRTFDLSILPYEDCCTVFTPRHPRLRPTEEALLEVEKALDVSALTEEALAQLRFCLIRPE